MNDHDKAIELAHELLEEFSIRVSGLKVGNRVDFSLDCFAHMLSHILMSAPQKRLIRECVMQYLKHLDIKNIEKAFDIRENSVETEHSATVH